MNFTRRMLTTTCLASVLGMAACATPTGNATPATVLADINGAVNGLLGVLPSLGTVIPAAQLAQITSYVNAGQALLSTFAAGLTASQGATVLLQVETYVNSALNALAGFPGIPANYALIISAAAVIVPIVEAYINSVLPSSVKSGVSPATLRAKAPWVVSNMTISQARLLLGIKA